MEKNRVKVALLIEKPPQIQIMIEFPKYGIADKRFVITVAPQKDICPQGRTYPTNAVIIVINKRIVPIIHVNLKLNEFI
jgi:outer membrane protein assembly factor BamE (lipoprotein component of BamABCDE complex)